MSEPFQVVALKYRPQNFEQLVGQENVWKGLAGAIQTDRIGNAYLFTGARGTGKTTTARIFAKCLNCLNAPDNQPTLTPCDKCDSCLGIKDGSDIDVIEMDAASNNGVDDVRELRQNAIIRPTRARFKIFIMDEAHMMSTAAFNALLKTLEEPPAGVKFIFCTTEIKKLPITIISRCIRFDFSNIQVETIAKRLLEIAHSEKVTIEPAALAILARRAGGSMRDSQSLLEQLLSFGAKEITAADVHDMLGTSDLTRLFGVLEKIAARDATGTLAEFAEALRAGADIGTLWDQLLGLLRDAMVVAVGGDEESLLHALPSDYATIRGLAERLGLETILAMVQIVDQTLARLRYLSQPRTLAEVALVRMCRLADLRSVAQLADALRNNTLGSFTLRIPTAGFAPVGLPAPAATQTPAGPTAPPVAGASELKKNDRSDDQPVTATIAPAAELLKTSENPSPPTAAPDEASAEAPKPAQNAVPNRDLLAAFQSVLSEMTGMVAENARLGVPATLGPNSLVLRFSKRYNFQKTYCERPENAAVIEAALQAATGRTIRVGTAFADGDESANPVPTQPQSREVARRTQQERLQHPFVKKAIERFGARVQRIDEPKPAELKPADANPTA